ncbi:hypothetical protein BH20BAC1_BH20BAC1_21400 [soil metagenome]
MTSQALIANIFRRLKRYSYIIILAGCFGAAGGIFYARQQPSTYTSKSSIFPLNSTADNTPGTSALNVLLGTEATKTFAEEASVNIIELAQSRTTREEVAAIRDSALYNKTIAELLEEDFNNHRGWFEDKMEEFKNDHDRMTWAGEKLKEGLTANINKNNTLVLTYTGRSSEVVRAVSYGFISKISQFYIELKREKAERDFIFANNKADSLRRVMNGKDQRLISMDKRTLFTNTTKLEYRVPTENLLADKQMIRQQYAQAVANQQNAAYKLQKATPLIRVLDKPDPPYDMNRKSSMVYGIIGILACAVVASVFIVSGLLLFFAKQEINKNLFGMPENVPVTTRPSTL